MAASPAGLLARAEAWSRRRRLRKTFGDRFTPPPLPWTEDYARRHTELVSFLLGQDDVLALFARDEALPPAYGRGFDERVVEYPWLLAQGPRGRTLDAGSTLNHAHVLDRVLPLVDELRLVTLAAEPVSFPERGVVYDYADLRALAYEDGAFDTVVSLSTLEHVGMDNSSYGVHAPRAADPRAEARRALRELRRVTAPGGRLLLTVPYGEPTDHGWFRQLDRAGLEDLLSAAEPCSAAVAVYRYRPDGWRRSSLDDAADARYWDHHSDPQVPADGAAAARAVACVSIEPRP